MRPVGHVTDLIKELEHWAQARERIAARHLERGDRGEAGRLDARPLRTAIAYLEEYRALLTAERQETGDFGAGYREAMFGKDGE